MRPEPRREREKTGRLRRDSLFSSLVGAANRYHFEYIKARSQETSLTRANARTFKRPPLINIEVPSEPNCASGRSSLFSPYLGLTKSCRINNIPYSYTLYVQGEREKAPPFFDPGKILAA